MPFVMFYRSLLEAQGPGAIEEFRACYPALRGQIYARGMLDPDRVLAGTDVVIAHEWTELERDVIRRAKHGGDVSAISPRGAGEDRVPRSAREVTSSSSSAATGGADT